MDVYLDYASLTPIDKQVAKEMGKFYSSRYSNPSSLHSFGVRAKKELEMARRSCASFLGALSDEVFFTSGATEANNLIILGVVEKHLNLGKKYQDLHIITSSIEHSSVLKTCQNLEKKGVNIFYLSVKEDGKVDLNEFKKNLKPQTILVSVMFANNETGVVQPIKDIAKIIRKFNQDKDVNSEINNRTLFHTDASQAALYLDLNVSQLGVDLLTLDGNKVYGPRNSALMFIKRRTGIDPVMFGGDQEGEMRPGTENLPSIVGLSKALEIISAHRPKEFKKVSQLALFFVLGFKKIFSDLEVNGNKDFFNLKSNKNRTKKDILPEHLPHILNLFIPKIDAEYFMFWLDAKGIAVSTKSACLSADESGSYVLKSMGFSDDRIKSSVRFSLGRFNTLGEIKRVLKEIKGCYNKNKLWLKSNT